MSCERQGAAGKKQRSRERRIFIGSLDDFRALAYLKENPDAQQEDLVKYLGVSPSTVKRSFLRLKKLGALEFIKKGRKIVHFDRLQGAKRAFVGVKVDIKTFQEIARGRRGRKRALPYRSEEAMLNYISKELIKKQEYKGLVVVEQGAIIMGSDEFGIMLVVVAAADEILFNFVRRHLEMLEGVEGTQTFVTAYHSSEDIHKFHQ